MGYVARLASWQWIYRIDAIVRHTSSLLLALLTSFLVQIEFCLALCYIFVCSETLYRGPRRVTNNIAKATFEKIVPINGKIDSKPLVTLDFVRPLLVLRIPSLSLVMFAYSIAHNFVLTFALVEFSALYIPRFRLDADQVGLNYISVVVGCVTCSTSPS